MSGTGKTASTEQIFVSILVFPPPVAGPFALPQGIQVVFPSLRAEGDRQGVSCNPFFIVRIVPANYKSRPPPFSLFFKGRERDASHRPKKRSPNILFVIYLFCYTAIFGLFSYLPQKRSLFSTFCKGMWKTSPLPLVKKAGEAHASPAHSYSSIFPYRGSSAASSFGFSAGFCGGRGLWLRSLERFSPPSLRPPLRRLRS